MWFLKPGFELGIISKKKILGIISKNFKLVTFSRTRQEKKHGID